MRSTTFLLAASLAVQQAAADWRGAKPFSACSTTPQQCNPQQSSGWTWGSLQVQETFTEFASFSFTGGDWSCASQFPSQGGKRDLIPRNNFQVGDSFLTLTALANPQAEQMCCSPSFVQPWYFVWFALGPAKLRHHDLRDQRDRRHRHRVHLRYGGWIHLPPHRPLLRWRLHHHEQSVR